MTDPLEGKILRLFDSEPTPLHAVVKMGRYSLSWLIPFIFRNKFGRPLNLFPFQSVWLDAFWYKKNIVLIAARGAGKCQSGDTLIQTSDGLYRLDELISSESPEMEEIDINLKVMGENNFNDIAYGWNNGITDTKIITTRQGYQVENTLDHKIRVLNDSGDIIWRDSDKVKIGDTIPIVRSLYNFGNQEIVTEDQAWFLGATIGDGMCTRKNYLLFSNIDDDIIDNWIRIGEEWSNKSVIQHPSQSKCNYYLYDIEFREKLFNQYNIDYVTAHYKKIPLCIRRSNSKIVSAFLSGLFDTDGTVNVKSVEYSTASEELAKQVQTCLLALGIFCRRNVKFTSCNGKRFKSFLITIAGSERARIFRSKIGFRCKRKQKRLDKLCNKKPNTNIDIIPDPIVQERVLALVDKYKSKNVIGGHGYSYTRIVLSGWRIKKYGITYGKLIEILEITESLSDDKDWIFLENIVSKNYFYDVVDCIEDGRCRTYDVHTPNDHTFISNGIISHNTFLLALYAALRALLTPGSEIIIVGAGLRQSLKVFNYIAQLYYQSPIFQESANEPIYSNTGPNIKIGSSIIVALPIGDGERIRGQRATNILIDEMSTLDENVFSTVIKPFAAVRADPEESVMVESFCDRLITLGCDEDTINGIKRIRGYGNQAIMAGTASYEFNHFYRYYQSYQMIIRSKGNVEQIKKAMEIGTRANRDNFSKMSREEMNVLADGWRNYAVCTMPYDKLPKGFLDEENVTQDKVHFTPAKFGREYEAKFTKDSEGFIKRSSIYEATPNGQDTFSIELYGDPAFDYVMGLDPAQHSDNFGCVILKMIPGAAQVVYATAWKGKDTPASARHIRNIMSRFNIVRIAMDQGGGGDAVAATLQLPELCQEGEYPILPVKENITDNSLFSVRGASYMMDLIKWSSQWIGIAAHGLAGDISHRRLLFPSYPNIDDIYEQYRLRVLKYGKQLNDEDKEKLIDGLTNEVFGKEDNDYQKIEEGIWDNVEATIDETCAIERQATPAGTEKFVLPDSTPQEEGMEVRRRDRFSALVLASYAARIYKNAGRKPSAPAGGSPDYILSRRNRRIRSVVRKGNVMY